MTGPAHDTRPTQPDHAAAFDAGRRLGLQWAFGKTPEALLEAQRAVGRQRLAYLTAGDWEGVWQATGLVQIIREAREG
jgi:hypothetical protein